MGLQFIDDLLALSGIVKQLKACGYECVAGRLENNVEFIRLEEIAARFPTTTEAQQQAKPSDAPRNRRASFCVGQVGGNHDGT